MIPSLLEGYSDEDDEDDDAGNAYDDENLDQDMDDGGAAGEERVDFRGVVQRIRTTCDIPEVMNTRRTNRVGYEKAIRPEQKSMPSILLPWSASLLDKTSRASQAVEEGKLDSARGSRLFRPPNPGHMRFYRPEGSNAGPADLSQTLAEYLNEELDSLRRT